MTAFLLDANLSPETAEFLRQTFGFDVALLRAEQLTFTDADVVAVARAEQRVIITHDLDFGEIYHFREHGQLGVIILRLDDQTVESVNQVLASFFSSDLSGIDLTRSLVVVTRDRVRIARQ